MRHSLGLGGLAYDLNLDNWGAVYACYVQRIKQAQDAMHKLSIGVFSNE